MLHVHIYVYTRNLYVYDSVSRYRSKLVQLGGIVTGMNFHGVSMKFVEGFTLTLAAHLPPSMLSKRSLKTPLNELPPDSSGKQELGFARVVFPRYNWKYIFPHKYRSPSFQLPFLRVSPRIFFLSFFLTNRFYFPVDRVRSIFYS